jgi:hypothetical protein
MCPKRHSQGINGVLECFPLFAWMTGEDDDPFVQAGNGWSRDA